MPRPQISKLIKKAVAGDTITQPVKLHPNAPVRLRSVQETFIHIQELDPITFLGRLMNGEPLEYVDIDQHGNKLISWEVATVTDRRKAAEFLAAKLMPTLHAHKIIPGTPNDTIEDAESVDDVFKKIVNKAIDKARSNEGA